jgi:K+-sensing histidine kinase KdpD
MPPKPTKEAQSTIESKTWWLIGLSIFLILGLSLTIPLLFLSLVRAGALQGLLPADGGLSLVIGLVGLAALFSLNLIYQQGRIEAMRRRVAQTQIELEQSKSRLAELTSLFQLGNSLDMDLPLQTILDITVQRVASTLHAHEADVFLPSSDQKSLRCASSLGLTRRPPEPDVPFGAGPIGSCARNGEGILLVAGAKGTPSAEFINARADTGSLLILPIRSERHCVGVLMIARSASAEPFRIEHRDVAQLFADDLGPVIDRTVASASLRQKAAAVADEPAIETAGAAGSFQDTFLRAAGHELRSPLAAILAYADVLDQNDRRMTPAMRSEFVGRVRSDTQRMMETVDEVLDLARLELGRYIPDLHPGNLNDVVREAIAAVRPDAAAKEVAIESSLDETIPAQHIDAAKLRRSAIYLLRNAIRFSPAKGRVAVATKLGDGDAQIVVLDGGPTFDPQGAAAIYELESGARSDPESARSGEGFGLHLTKRFVELHGGTVGAGVASDGSSMFWIQLPWSRDLTPAVGTDPLAEELVRIDSGF